MKRLIQLSLLAVLILIARSDASADTWTAFSYDGSNPLADGSPSAMIFTLENGHLSLNSSSITTLGNSSAMKWTLLFSGNWAACGSVDESGAYSRDPYASFVRNGEGGYIQWQSNTPAGYVTSLMLGRSFDGDGASSYTNRWGQPMDDVSASIVLNTHPKIWGSEYNLYEPVNHTFMASYSPVQATPEPTGLVSLLTGGVSLLGFTYRVRRFHR